MKTSFERTSISCCTTSGPSLGSLFGLFKLHGRLQSGGNAEVRWLPLLRSLLTNLKRVICKIKPLGKTNWQSKHGLRCHKRVGNGSDSKRRRCRVHPRLVALPATRLLSRTIRQVWHSPSFPYGLRWRVTVTYWQINHTTYPIRPKATGTNPAGVSPRGRLQCYDRIFTCRSRAKVWEWQNESSCGREGQAHGKLRAGNKAGRAGYLKHGKRGASAERECASIPWNVPGGLRVI